MLNGLDLFSGFGGISLALRNWVRPVAYCEIEPYAQGILLSRMREGQLYKAPIWDDITSLDGRPFRGYVDIIYGGFPCQDLSVAGSRNGLEGKRSGLFFQLCRVVEEIEPRFIFLENVPGIRTKGLLEVVNALTVLGYDCRWTCISAEAVGAPHLRKRWFLLAHANGKQLRHKSGRGSGKDRKSQDELRVYGQKESVANTDGLRESSEQNSKRVAFDRLGHGGENGRDWQGMANTHGEGLEVRQQSENKEKFEATFRRSWWELEPPVGRVVNGRTPRMDKIITRDGRLYNRTTGEEISEEALERTFRKDRIKALGNGVVPLQVREAFIKLSGMTERGYNQSE